MNLGAQWQSNISSAHRSTSAHEFLSKVVIDPLSIDPEQGLFRRTGRLVSYFISLFFIIWWRGEDLNLRRHPPADLQSAPFGHLGTPPVSEWSWRWDSNPQPADYKSAALPIELRQRRKKTYLVLKQNARQKIHEKKICFNRGLKQKNTMFSRFKDQTASPTGAGSFPFSEAHPGCIFSPAWTGSSNSCDLSLKLRTNLLFKLCPEQ